MRANSASWSRTQWNVAPENTASTGSASSSSLRLWWTTSTRGSPAKRSRVARTMSASASSAMTRPSGRRSQQQVRDATGAAAGVEHDARHPAARGGRGSPPTRRPAGRRRGRTSPRPTCACSRDAARWSASTALAVGLVGVDRVALLQRQPMSSRPLSRRCLMSGSISKRRRPARPPDLLRREVDLALARPPRSRDLLRRSAAPAAGRSSCSSTEDVGEATAR